jgi:arginyl-tRNA synthetase
LLREKTGLNEETFSQIKPPFLEFPKGESFGDISTTLAFKLAPILKRPPHEISRKLIEHIKEEIPGSGLKNLIEKIEIRGAGFINFYFSRAHFYSILKKILEDKDYFVCRDKNPKRALVEFVSANPTGLLSVAHGRQAAVGDSLCNILQLQGYEVSREYYLNDEGNQINILGDSIALRARELKGEKIVFPENYYQGGYIIDLAREALEKTGNVSAEPDYYKDYGCSRILEIIKKELDDFGVRFDSWYSQKALSRSGKIEEAIAFLKDKGHIYEKDGAVWFRSTKFGDDKDRVIVRSEGSYTYLAPDIAYHRDKFKRGFDWLINLWGPDHHGYAGRVKAAIEALGKDKSALDIIIVQLATLYKQGKIISMSTRKGEYVTLRQVLDGVGRDAARFFFLMRKTDSHLDFDLELAKQQGAENPVYYIQYAHARIAGILTQADIPLAQLGNSDLTLLKEKEELKLLKELAKFEYVLKIALAQLDPYGVSAYLQGLAESLHRFYDANRVLVDDKSLRQARLALILGCKTVISLGLRLLGVSAPEKM